jgi:Putative transposase/Transposase zinc-binding domain
MAPVAPHCHAAPGGAQGSAPQWEVADILRLHGDTYGAAHPVPPPHHKVMHDIMVCRTAKLGGHAEQCGQCGFERYAYNSCRNRHCPKCQTLTKEKWLEDRKAELLEVPYFHCVFTLPHELNPLVLTNKRALLTMLLRATSQTLLQFGHHNLGGQLGGILLLHTWDQTLQAHFHVHALVPGGALADQGTRWVSTPPRFFFPVHALGTVFRAKFLEALHTSRETLVWAEQTGPLASAQGWRQFIDLLYNKVWVVYAKRPMAGPRQVLAYLGRYTHRVAIANHRIVEVKEGQVRFSFRDRRQGNRLETMALPAHAFIRRFLLHVLPHGLQRLRHIGFLANRCKAQALRQCRHLLHQPEPPRPQKKTVAEWMWQLTGTDLTRCPQCGHGPLQRVPLTSPPPRPKRPVVPPVWDSS